MKNIKISHLCIGSKFLVILDKVLMLLVILILIQFFGAGCLNVVGQSVDRKSSVCPNPVKGLSNHEEKYRVCPIKYRVCQKSVKSLSNQNDPGQRLETKIQYLSRHCPTKKFREADSDLLQSLDKHWTWTNFGQGAYFFKW